MSRYLIVTPRKYNIYRMRNKYQFSDHGKRADPEAAENVRVVFGFQKLFRAAVHRHSSVLTVNKRSISIPK